MKLGLRIWILIIALIISLLAINPLLAFNSGVVVKSVEKNSSAFDSGLRDGEVIVSINGEPIKSKEDYGRFMEEFFKDGQMKKIEIATKKDTYLFFANETPKITVDNLPKTRIQTGLDLRGGARALVQPNGTLTDSQLEDLISVSRNRFNVYGLSDVQIRGVSDLEGNKYMLIEVAGATPADLEKLVAQQGKFEAKIGNESVFHSGKQDITSICKNDARCAGIRSCSETSGGYQCSFDFLVYLTPEAAERHALITKNISLDETGKYLSEKLYLYVDDVEVSSLFISSDLKGKAETQISIQGYGVGSSQEEAYNEAKKEMNHLQTILQTGSLPYKLTIVKLDTISPTLGSEFSKNIIIAGAVSLLVVSIIIFVKYRKIKSSLALLFTSFSELVIILGVAAFIKWNLDLPSIAGILATIGTGVDSQIVILDEARKDITISLKERIKRALFVVFAAYATSVASLIPLGWAGAGLFKGFAITTIIGITVGVFISRPAFAEIIRKIEEE